MKKFTKVDIKKDQSAKGFATRKVAQCCTKDTNLVAGCHD
jgi:hypothetical protein